MASQDNNAGTQMVSHVNQKSVGVAYLLWLFLGGLGVHRFYLGQSGTGIVQLLLALLGWLPLFIGWIILGIWLVIDIILIPGMAERENMRVVIN